MDLRLVVLSVGVVLVLVGLGLTIANRTGAGRVALEAFGIKAEGSGGSGLMVVLLGVVVCLGALLAPGGKALDNGVSAEAAAPPAAVAAPTTVDTTQAALRRAEKVTASFLSAMQKGDVETLVSLSAPPFFMDNGGILLSKADIRARYVELFSQRGPAREPLDIDSIKPELLSELKAKGMNPEHDRLLQKLRLGDDDIAVTATSKGEGIILYFRRNGGEVELAGAWD